MSASDNALAIVSCTEATVISFILDNQGYALADGAEEEDRSNDKGMGTHATGSFVLIS
jgi:hypothetical protein